MVWVLLSTFIGLNPRVVPTRVDPWNHLIDAKSIVMEISWIQWGLLYLGLLDSGLNSFTAWERMSKNMFPRWPFWVRRGKRACGEWDILGADIQTEGKLQLERNHACKGNHTNGFLLWFDTCCADGCLARRGKGVYRPAGWRHKNCLYS